MKRFIALCLLMVLAVPALAQDQPIVSMSRVSAALGLNYAWYGQGGDQLAPKPVKEFEVGPYVAYSLLSSEPNALGVSRPILSLAASSVYGLDSKLIRTSVGLRLVLFAGGR